MRPTLHARLREALRPFVNAADCEENRLRIIKVILNILPTATTLEARVVAIGILQGKGIEDAKKTAEIEIAREAKEENIEWLFDERAEESITTSDTLRCAATRGGSDAGTSGDKN